MADQPGKDWSIEPEGKGEWIGHRIAGKREGSWCYYEGNALRKTVRYVGDAKQGSGFVFGESGNLLRSMEFDGDRVHGISRFYARDGQLVAAYNYIYDKLEGVEYYLLHEESPPKDKLFLPEF